MCSLSVGRFIVPLLLVSFCHGGILEFEIQHTWNGSAIDHPPVKFRLEPEPDSNTDVRLTIDRTPFFDNTPPPAKPGEPLWELWNYEVVEAFFLNAEEEKYLEVEIGPGGQHIVLLIHHPRNAIRHSIPLKTSTYIEGETWSGHCTIPGEYFPYNVTKFNAYAKHDDINGVRHLEALYPADPSEPEVDFHNLDYFQPIDLSVVIEGYPVPGPSQFWIDALDGVFRYDISTQWNSVPIDHPTPVEVTIQAHQDGVKLNVVAPFFDDPAPPEPAGSLMGLWNYEVAEMFFLNDMDEYLEVEVAPHGHYIVLLLNGQSNSIADSLALEYTATISEDRKSWSGEVVIPAAYFPPNVTRMNTYAIHNGPEPDSRVYEALYPAPENDPDYPSANFHRLELFQKIDFEYQLKDNSDYSDIWLDALNPKDGTALPSEDSTNQPLVTDQSLVEEQKVVLKIERDWRGETLLNDDVEVKMWLEDESFLNISIDAPFHNDPSPRSDPGTPTVLDQNEVVEIYFANNKEHIIQVQVSPEGQYNVRLYNTPDNSLRQFLPLQITTEIQGPHWTANIALPLSYLPGQVNSMNIYSKHGNSLSRQVAALYSYRGLDNTNPSQYKLSSFRAHKDVLELVQNVETSKLWQDSLLGILRYEVPNGEISPPLEMTLQGFQGGVEVNITASSQEPQCLRLLLKTNLDEYILLDLSSGGEERLVFINRLGNIVNIVPNVDFISQQNQNEWIASAFIEQKFLPNNVNSFNIITNVQGVVRALYPLSKQQTSLTLMKSSVQKVDFEHLQPRNKNTSSYFNNIVNNFKYSDQTTNYDEICPTTTPDITYTISKTWDGTATNQNQATIKLQPINDDLLLTVSALYHKDPEPKHPFSDALYRNEEGFNPYESSGLPPSSAFRDIWKYEVVDAFFLNDANQYLQVQLSPTGHHLVLLYAGRQRSVRFALPLHVQAYVDDDTWTAYAVIPHQYFPANVTKFNANAINGVGLNRRFYSLYPSTNTVEPDFHDLKAFQPINLTSIITPNMIASPLWDDAIKGIVRFNITKDAYGTPLPHSHDILMKGYQAGVEINTTTTFIKNPSRTTFEELELTFTNNDLENISIRIVANGQQTVQIFNGLRRTVPLKPVDYISFVEEEMVSDDVDGVQSHWLGSLLVPPAYFPANVTHFSLVAYKCGVSRSEEDSESKSSCSETVLFNHRPIDFEFLVEESEAISPIWRTIIKRRNQNKLIQQRRRIELSRRRNSNTRGRPRAQQSQVSTNRGRTRFQNTRGSTNRGRSRSQQSQRSSSSSLLRPPTISTNELRQPQAPPCAVPGLFRDRTSCSQFYECVIEKGELRYYRWRCVDSMIFDEQQRACVVGAC